MTSGNKWSTLPKKQKRTERKRKQTKQTGPKHAKSRKHLPEGRKQAEEPLFNAESGEPEIDMESSTPRPVIDPLITLVTAIRLGSRVYLPQGRES